MATALIDDLIQQMNDLDNGDLWLDENFDKKLSVINDAEAFTRPLPELHSAAELLSHLIEWRRINIRRLHGETLVVEIEDPVNWRSNDELRPRGWKAIVADFYTSKQEVIALLKGKEDSYLDSTTTHHGKDVKYLLQGLVHHDCYHLGQLGLVVKFLKK